MHTERGISLVEVVVVAGIFSGAIVTMLSMYASQTSVLLEAAHELQASLLLEEGIEIVRYRRDIDWDTSLGAYVTGGTMYHFSFNNAIDEWQVLAGVDDEFIDNQFERTVRFYPVLRDATTDDIVTAGGVSDPDARRVEVTVRWFENGATTTRTLNTYFTNVFKNS